MADDSPSPSPAIGDPNSQKSDPNTPNSKLNPSPTPPPPPQVASLEPTLVSHPSPNIPPPYAPPQIPGAPVASLPPPPPFRPGLQFAPVASFQNPSISTLGVPPPGVSSAMPMAPPGSVPPPMTSYQAPPGQVPAVTALRPFPPIANGYAGMPGVAPHGVMPPPGIPRYPSPYAAMIRPGFPLRPPGAVGTVPLVPRPPVPGIPGVRPVMPPVFRPAAVPSVTPAEEPQTTIYIGKIATVENDFMLSILQFCGPVKHWIRAQDPTTGKPKGFGFYEFESAEGALRTIRLLSKLIIDGQELLVNVNQATKKYLLRYVEKKMENAKKAKESQAVGSEESKAEGCEEEKEKEKMESSNKNESIGLIKEETKNEGEPKSKENIDIANSAVVSDEEREADREALEKIKNAIEERIKTKPLPPPPPPPLDGSGMELAVKAKDGDDADTARNDDVDHKSEVETSSEQTRPDTSSPDWSRKHDRRSRDREKDQEMDRYEREAERERARKEREQRRKLEDAERAYQARLRQWERREREKEKEWQYEKEREKEKERKRKKEIRHEEDEDEDEDDSRRRWHRSSVEDRRRRRLREKEDDLADRLKEEEEVAEAKRKAEEEKLQQQHLDALRLLSGQSITGSEKVQTPAVEGEEKEIIQSITESAHGNHLVDIFQNGSDNETPMAVDNGSETQQGENAPSKKLGFGLIGSGKRTTVPSVFHEEDEEAHKDKKLRPLVPIDYSTEEQQAVQIAGSGDTPPHLAAAAEFAKRLSNSNPKETSESERERSRRSDKGGHRDKDRNQDSGKEPGKAKTPDTKKLLDAKQLIDTIPKTKDELFSYEINWAIYDKHQLHERMRPWISKKITEFLGEEETTLVDYIVSNTQEHVKASQMLELLQSILDEEAEMFVLKMWRMLIFEIKRVESGLPVKSKA